jgi:AraC family transcriptional regulator
MLDSSKEDEQLVHISPPDLVKISPLDLVEISPTDLVEISPPDLVERHFAEWQGLRVELVVARQRVPFDCHFRSDHHLLIVAEHAERDDGETSVEGLPISKLRNLSRKMTFVPAGHEFHGWQHPRVLTRVSFFYIDPRGPLLDKALDFAGIDFRPRLFFFDPDLWQLTVKLKDEVLNGGARWPHYGEALSVLLAHELIRLNNGSPLPQTVNRGGLSGWQQRRVADFIEEHLSEEVRLSDMAELVDLSPFHFARAFKQSFGMPPHRYHVSRRIERAKTLLAQPQSSVTEIALAVGFAETSSFSAAFRKTTGSAPSDYRRGLG